jgi:hypothetical protein
VSDTIESTKQTGGLSKLQTILDNVQVGKPMILAAQNAIENLKGVVQQLGILASAGGGDVKFSISANWLSSPMTQLAMNITLLVQNMKESRKAELMATLTGIFMQWDSAKASAAMKLNAAEAQATMEQFKGVTGAVEAGGGLGSGLLAGGAARAPASSWVRRTVIDGGGGTAFTQIVSGGTKSAEGFVNSKEIVAQKQAETQADLSDTEKGIYNQITQSASKSFDELEDLLKKALETFANMWSTNARAQNTLTQNKQG